MKVHVLTIETHDDRVETRVCANEEIAWNELHKYVAENWYQVQEDTGEMPEDEREAIRIYFKMNRDEGYLIDENELIQHK